MNLFREAGLMLIGDGLMNLLHKFVLVSRLQITCTVNFREVLRVGGCLKKGRKGKDI